MQLTVPLSASCLRCILSLLPFFPSSPPSCRIVLSIFCSVSLCRPKMLCEKCQLLRFRTHRLARIGSSLGSFTRAVLQSKESKQSKESRHNSPERLDIDDRPMPYYRHSSNLDDLQSSAHRGCQLCRFLLAGLQGCNTSIGADNSIPDVRIELSVQAYGMENMFSSFLARQLHVICGEKESVFTVRKVWDDAKSVSGDGALDGAVIADIAHSTGSPATMDLIRHWIQRCDSGNCVADWGGAGCIGDADNGGIPLLPTRVIDVGPKDGSQNPFLFVSSGQAGRYIALSHCWGTNAGTKPPVTEQATISSHQTGIPMSDLPKTFSEAVIVVRELGYRYLWIDSLCIVQDSTADWEFEASHMGDYYANAALTIAAADSRDCHGGLFVKRDIAALYPCVTKIQDRKYSKRPEQVTLETDRDDRHWASSLDPGLLQRRGWTLQEKVLSPKFLEFGRHQVSFTCPTKISDERSPGGRDNQGHSLGQILSRPVEEDDGEVYNLYAAWYRVMQDYAERELTYEGDILPALSGLAARFTSHLAKLGRQDEYLAGMWKSRLELSLCWFTWEPGRRPRAISVIPSWSWASVRLVGDGTGLEFHAAADAHNYESWFQAGTTNRQDSSVSRAESRRERVTTFAVVISASAIVAGLNPFGAVTEGWVKIKCPVLDSMYLVVATGSTESTEPTRLELTDPLTGKLFPWFHADDKDERDAMIAKSPVLVTCALIASDNWRGGGKMICLVLLPIESAYPNTNQFRRVGSFYFWKKEVDISTWPETEMTII